MKSNTNLKTSKQAIVSLILSILWLLGVGSLIAIVLGHKARSDIKKNSETLKGKGIALAGLILGYLGVVLTLIILFIQPYLLSVGDKSKVDLTCVNMATTARTLDMFKLDNSVYPTQEEGLDALMANPNPSKYPNYSSRAYLTESPKDAWGGSLVYLNYQGKIDLMSLGADRKEGGEGDEKDILLSECSNG